MTLKKTNKRIRGVIESILDFPALSDRMDGDEFLLKVTGDIRDPKILVAATPGTNGTATADESHANPENPAYGKVTASGEIDIPLVVGDKIMIGTIVRYVREIVSALDFKLDFILPAAVTAEKLYVWRSGEWFDTTRTITLTSGANYNAHKLYANTNYKKVIAGDDYSARIFVGDKITFTIGSGETERTALRTVTAITSAYIVLDEAIGGDISQFVDYDVDFTLSWTAFVIDDTEGDNDGKVLRWTDDGTIQYWLEDVSKATV